MKLFDEIPSLEDDTLLLHALTEADANVLEAMASNPAVTRYIPTFLFENQFDDKKEAIRKLYQAPFIRKESLILGVYQKADPDTLIGLAEIYQYEPYWNKASIGFRLNQPYWHQGFAERIIALLRQYLFEQTDVKRITAHVMVQNIYSQRALQRVGFRLRKANDREDWGFREAVPVHKYVLEKLGNISYVKIGSGPKTMVMLPGLALKSTLGSADLIEEAYGALFQEYTIWVFDDRSNLEANYTIRERAGDVAAEMRTLHLHDAFVFGASMGGMVGQYLAIDHPDLVRKLVVSASAPFLCDSAKQVFFQWKALAEARDLENLIHTMVTDLYASQTVAQYGEVLEHAIGVVSDQDLSDFILLVEASLRCDCYEELSKISCPVLVTGSFGDRILFPEGSIAIAKKLGCNLYLYNNQYGHAIYDEAADHKQKILAFFEEP